MLAVNFGIQPFYNCPWSASIRDENIRNRKRESISRETTRDFWEMHFCVLYCESESLPSEAKSIISQMPISPGCCSRTLIMKVAAGDAMKIGRKRVRTKETDSFFTFTSLTIVS